VIEDDRIYRLRLCGPDRGVVLEIAGKRPTIIEAALHVAMDLAPKWDTRGWPRPAFTIELDRVTG